MVTSQKFSPSAKIFMVPKVTVRPPSGRWTSRSVDKGGGVPTPPVKLAPAYLTSTGPGANLKERTPKYKAPSFMFGCQTKGSSHL